MTTDPNPPGKILFEDFMDSRGISINRLAQDILVPANRISEIIRGRRAITADTAIRLAKFFGNPVEFWLNLQQAYDLHLARQSINNESQISSFQLEQFFPDVPDDETDLFEFVLRRVGHIRFQNNERKAGVTFLRESGLNVLYWTAWDDLDGALVAYQMTMLRLPNSAPELRCHVAQLLSQGFIETSVTPNFRFLLDELKAKPRREIQ